MARLVTTMRNRSRTVDTIPLNQDPPSMFEILGARKIDYSDSETVWETVAPQPLPRSRPQVRRVTVDNATASPKWTRKGKNEVAALIKGQGKINLKDYQERTRGERRKRLQSVYHEKPNEDTKNFPLKKSKAKRPQKKRAPPRPKQQQSEQSKNFERMLAVLNNAIARNRGGKNDSAQPYHDKSYYTHSKFPEMVNFLQGLTTDVFFARHIPNVGIISIVSGGKRQVSSTADFYLNFFMVTGTIRFILDPDEIKLDPFSFLRIRPNVKYEMRNDSSYQALAFFMREDKIDRASQNADLQDSE